MAIIQSGGGAGTALLVDPTFAAARVTVRPQEVLGWCSIGAATGLMTGLAAGTPVFSFRNLSINPVIVRRAGIGFVTTTAFTTAQAISFGLQVARAFTTSDSGGTAIAFTGNNAKHRTALGTPTSLDCRIAANRCADEWHANTRCKPHRDSGRLVGERGDDHRAGAQQPVRP